jgi:hypothetical protein
MCKIGKLNIIRSSLMTKIMEYTDTTNLQMDKPKVKENCTTCVVEALQFKGLNQRWIGIFNSGEEQSRI